MTGDFPTLAEVLDRGELPADDWFHDMLVEGLVMHATSWDLTRSAANLRGEGHIIDAVPRMIVWEWIADLMEDPTLIPRLMDALDPFRRAEAECRVDAARRPHPFELVEVGEVPEQCSNCGAFVPTGAQVVALGTREGWSELPYPITYCRPCVALVGAVASQED